MQFNNYPTFLKTFLYRSNETIITTKTELGTKEPIIQCFTITQTMYSYSSVMFSTLLSPWKLTSNYFPMPIALRENNLLAHNRDIHACIDSHCANGNLLDDECYFKKIFILKNKMLCLALIRKPTQQLHRKL